MELPQKRFKIQHAPSDQPLVLPTDISYYTQIDFPPEQHNRSKYIHGLNYMLEDKLFKKEDIDLDILEKISSKLEECLFFGNNRDAINESHRKFIWVIRSRIAIIIHNKLPKEEKLKKECPIYLLKTLDELNLIISVDALFYKAYDYSLLVLWKSLILLTKYFHTLKYFEELDIYVHALHLSCAKFFLLDSSDGTLYNHAWFFKIYKENGIEYFTVNDRFILDTERLFFYMQKRLLIRKELNCFDPPRGIYKSNNISIFIRILQDTVACSSKIIEKRMYQRLPEWNVIIGERERFKNEDKFSEPSGFNIISTYRQEKLAEITKIFDNNIFSILLKGCKKYIEDLNKNKTNENIYMIDINFEMICMEVTGFIHDNTIECKQPFEFFVNDQDHINYPLKINSFYKEKYPCIIHCFSEWFIFDPMTKYAYVFPTFIECYISWIRLLYEMDDTNLLIRTLKAHGLIKLYKKIFEADSNLDNMNMELLPSHYQN